MLKEFKNFIMTGNVIDFAVAVIMAGALGGVIKGFVDNIAMPFVGYFAGGMNFEDLHVAMDGNEYATLAAAKEAGGAVIAWGAWVNTIINLLIVRLVLFLIVKEQPEGGVVGHFCAGSSSPKRVCANCASFCDLSAWAFCKAALVSLIFK